MTTTAPTVKCRVCANEVPADAARCPKCSAAIGEQPPCPHCRATAGASPDAELRFRCDVCGGPRVPRAKGFTPSGREVQYLQVAEKARRGRAFWRAIGVALGLAVPFTTALLMLFTLMFGLGIGVGVAALFTLGPLAAGLVAAVGKARAKSREIAPALDAAWVSVANDLATSTTGTLTPTEMAARLGITDAQAEELGALLDVNAAVSRPEPPLRIEAAHPGHDGAAGGPKRQAQPGPTVPGDATALAAAAEEEAAAAEAEAGERALPPKRAP